LTIKAKTLVPRILIKKLFEKNFFCPRNTRKKRKRRQIQKYFFFFFVYFVCFAGKILSFQTVSKITHLRNFDFRALPADVRKGSAFPSSFARRFEAAPQIISTKSEAQPRR
jgi:hypothetical protein